MNRCDFFVFPSLYEGFGFPILEAMACGAPVITTRRGAIVEVAGEAVRYCDVDAKSIAEAILALAGDRAESRRLGEAGRERAAQFNWDSSIARHEQLFRAVV
jgi:glycosyltransferase involved in cell wall biosynthesis